ncbi:acyclic terpene utilization AtuA family protein [Brevibacillus brevis]|uniref:Acyclic terpene utilization AtuA family protein n=1 Tax=Brevibacillus brevis TaxID=1393 RepID=A0ABY9T2H2_BREBE|nr:acyclic terpene utilization AtuA family protein [Brevibacillus brevis]WNC14304.1 acyclic terpene utilization AtuA family protein [Brevibacillus brevis]
MLRIGSGAGFAGDRLEPAVLLAERGGLDYLVLECLAERTIALAQRRKLKDPAMGYDSLLEKRLEPLLPILKKNGIRLVTNMGAANPVAAAEKIVEIAKRQGIAIKVAAVTGDDVLGQLSPGQRTLEAGEPLSSYGPLISANAYIGADALLPALETGADIVVAGRVADPSLFLAPMMHHFGWSWEETDKLAQGTVIGHLLECAGQITGGYFADPGKKDVAGLAELGFPFADVEPDGSAVISKVEGTGGVIHLGTVKEQLLYEVTDPYAYLTPDSTVDFSSVSLRQLGPDRVQVSGGKGSGQPETLKVSVGYHAGYIGEGEISYAGSNAPARARLAGEIIRERLTARSFSDIRIDLIGCNSVHRTSFGHGEEPYEVRLRVAAKASSQAVAEQVGEEVEALYTNGPAGGGGARKYVHEVVGIVSVLIPRDKVQTQVTIREC